MSSPKRALVTAAGLGMGVTIALALIAAGLAWYRDRPRPWNTSAIIAHYDTVKTDTENNSIEFIYIVENNTTKDYQLNRRQDFEIVFTVQKQNSFLLDQDKLSIALPIFIPSGHRQIVMLNLKHSFPFNQKPRPDASMDEGEEYIRNQMRNLDGFVLFDKTNRYEIHLPAGWKKGV